MNKQKTIIIIKNIREYNDLLKMRFEGTKQIIALTYACYSKAIKKDKTIVPVWNYIEDAEVENELRKCDELIELYWIDFFSACKKENYAKIALGNLYNFLEEALVSHLVIENILKKEMPKSVINFCKHREIPCEEGNWDCSVFDAILEYSCEKQNISYEVINSDASNQNELRNNAETKIPLKHLLMCAFGNLVLPLLWVKYFIRKDAVCLNWVEDGGSVKRHKWFFDKFKNKSGQILLNLYSTEWAFVRSWSAGVFSRIRDKRQAKKEYRQLSANFQVYKNRITQLPAIFNNHLLDYHWNYLLWISVFNRIYADRIARRTSSLFKPKLVFVTQPTNVRTSALCSAYKDLRVKTFLLPHAAIPYDKKHLYQIFDYVLVNGKYQVDFLERLGVEQNKQFRINDGRNNIQKSVPRQNIINEFGLKGSHIVTVVTRNLQGGIGYFPKSEKRRSMKKTYRFLVECSKLKESYYDVEVIIKSHPLADYYELYDDFEDIIHIRRRPVGDLLAISDIVVFVGPITDVLFEAAKLEKQIVFCDCGNEKGFLEIVGNGIALVDSPDELHGVVERLLRNKAVGKINFSWLRTFEEVPMESSLGDLVEALDKRNSK